MDPDSFSLVQDYTRVITQLVYPSLVFQISLAFGELAGGSKSDGRLVTSFMNDHGTNRNIEILWGGEKGGGGGGVGRLAWRFEVLTILSARWVGHGVVRCSTPLMY